MSDISSLFTSTTGGLQPLKKARANVAEVLANGGAISAKAVESVTTFESRSAISDVEFNALSDLSTTLRATLESLHSSLTSIGSIDAKDAEELRKAGKQGSVPSYVTMESRVQAAFSGMVMASDKAGTASMTQRLQVPKDTDNSFVVADSAGGYDRRLALTTEAFQNYDLTNSRIFSTLFNYSIVDFDDFTRTFWRPVTMSPDNSFVELMINLLTVFNGIERDISGRDQDWGRNNLVRAIADHKLLHTDMTRAIPVVRTESEKYFAPAALFTPADIKQAGRDITTAPLKFGVPNSNYINLCQPGWLTKTGTLDQRDGLDRSVNLEKIYIALGDDYLEFPVKGIAGTEFNRAPQGDQQRIQLVWTNATFRVNKDTLNVDKSALTDLASVVSLDLELHLRMNVYFDLNIETGSITHSASAPTIGAVVDPAGLLLAETDPRYVALQTAVDTFKEAHFVLEAYRHNANRRQRGQLINIRQFSEQIVVPWRDPIAVERPAHGQMEQDTADLTALMSATRIRIHNEGVTALLEAEGTIRATANTRYQSAAEIPNTVGVGRYYVLPTYSYEKLDMMKIVDSIKSADRAADIQAAIIATIRNRVAHAYTNSQFKAAQDALSGGTMPKPKVALVTDPIVARYILEPGELRNLVDFELIVVPILDFRMRGKIRMVFITDDGGNDVNYLNFGYLFWSPEHVLVANMTREGGYNRETQLQPRYRFYVACPVMISIDIDGIEEALAKMPLFVDMKDRP